MGKASKQGKGGITSPKSMPQETVKYEPSLDVKKDLIDEHLPPIGLVFTVIVCSGFLFMFAFRDVFATGRNVGGEMDEAYLVRRFIVLMHKACHVITGFTHRVVFRRLFFRNLQNL